MVLNKKLMVEAASVFGTPAYLYDADILKSSYMELRNALPDCVDIFYALKVNPNLSLVKLIRSYGANTEVCSLGELEIVLKAGVQPSDVIFLGPCKKEEELERALAVGVFAIVVESETELKRISRLAARLDIVAPVAIRINPNFSASGSPWKMGGRPTHFGIEEETAIENFGRYASDENLNVRGIHVYNGTKILDAQSVYDNCLYILNLYRAISEKHGLNFTMVDVGGGLGIKYYENEQDLDCVKLKALLTPLFTEFKQRYPATRIILESGRFIAGRCASLLVTVDNIKKNHGKTFAVTDGGTNCNSSASGSGQVLKRNFQIVNVTKRPNTEIKEYHVSGPLCNPDDLLGRNVRLEEIAEGDILAVTSSGAYGPTASPVLFHSHGHPAEIIASNGRLFLARKRDTAESMLSFHTDVGIDTLLGAPQASQTAAPACAGTQEKVADVLRVVLNVPATTRIAADSHLRDDLGLDSLSSMELLVGLEDAISGFFVNPDTILARNFNTVATLVEYIDANRLSAATAATVIRELQHERA